MLVPNRHGSSDSYRYGFNGKEKDDEIKGEGNSYDFGARMLDVRVGRWFKRDPFYMDYPFASPYNYALNTPIQAKDPDGNVVLFINGQHAGSGGQAKYWGGYDQKVMDKLGDHSARYIDGAMGGWKNTITRTIFAPTSFLTSLRMSNLFSSVRKREGQILGYEQAASIYDNLKEGETVKIVTHSMGTAYARGYIKGMMKWAKANGKEFAFEYELDVNAYQGKDLPIDKNIKQTDNKTGGLDGGIGIGYGFKTHGTVTGTVEGKEVEMYSMQSVAPVPDATNISTVADKTIGHDVKYMSTDNIKTLGNGGDKKAIENGNNNENK